ncbi:MAG: leucine-rich repeat domain-containing protein [Prevotella sp.]|nr:leucine-rich repeat domain-containing protein [Prevotella sp.]
MKKNLLLTMLAFLLPLSAFCADYTDEQGVEYTFTKGEFSMCHVSGHTSDYASEIVIPEVIEGRKVIYIWDYAFQGCSRLTSIKIPNSVTTIFKYAFNGCSSLTSIEIPSRVSSIWEGAFQDCSSLTSIEIPSRVSSIKKGVFKGCSSLASVEIPNSITSIGLEAFRDCSSLTSIDIPSSVTSIDIYAFWGCRSLTSVEIPNSVTRIGGGAFYGCINLTSIVIPNSVTSIENNVFSGCKNVSKIYSYIKNPSDVNLGAVPCYESAILYVPLGTKEKYQNQSSWNKFSNIVEMGVLVDGEEYTIDTDLDVEVATYTRSFSESVAGHYQAWFVPFDYTVAESDAGDFTFYKIHMIAASDKDVEVADDSKVYIYIEPVEPGTVLKANKPYIVKAASALTDHAFTSENVTLRGRKAASSLKVTTAQYDYDFYGTYSDFSSEDAHAWLSLNVNGNIFWNKSTSSLKPYRWYLKVSSSSNNDDYSKLNFVVTEDDDAATTGISAGKYDFGGEIEGVFTATGLKVDAPVKGLNIIKYTDGRAKKIYMK